MLILSQARLSVEVRRGFACGGSMLACGVALSTFAVPRVPQRDGFEGGGSMLACGVALFSLLSQACLSVRDSHVAVQCLRVVWLSSLFLSLARLSVKVALQRCRASETCAEAALF